ncbi:DUF3073 domain-containing protein [Nesterenkonia sp. MY13]|uniref:DUF3073 domain-containing protein n=1 Tax=Nesterenkonia sedimenti TaxID=1463632 RepID=A0A7X8TKB2_9MICC|nr:DUF3073 domain-containing protein [Nesterenkonia sedimenti]NLS09917.1 DUF3073 domain-containing protein [Nesterenkonia sedimenti]
MGRGRQKAKATKQAREIKYFTPNTDLSALERELAEARGENPDSHDGNESDDYDTDRWDYDDERY